MGFLLSCGSEESFTDKLQGEWQLLSYSITNCSDDSIPETTLNADNNGCIVIFEEKSCISISIGNNELATLTIEYDDNPEETEFATATYVVDEANGTVALTVDGDTQTARFVGDNLVLTTREEGCDILLTFSK